MKMLTITTYCQFQKTALILELKYGKYTISGRKHGPEQKENCTSFVPVQSFALGVSKTSIASTDSFPRSEQIPVICWTIEIKLEGCGGQQIYLNSDSIFMCHL